MIAQPTQAPEAAPPPPQAATPGSVIPPSDANVSDSAAEAEARSPDVAVTQDAPAAPTTEPLVREAPPAAPAPVLAREAHSDDPHAADVTEPAAVSDHAHGPPAAEATRSPSLDLTAVAAFALAAFSSPDPQQGGVHDPLRDGFNLTSLELAIGAAADPYFRFDGVLAFEDGEAEIEEAYVTTLALPHHLRFRGGRFLTRFGRSNAQHPHAWTFVDQPFALTRLFGGEGNKGLGVELSYTTPSPLAVELIGALTMAEGDETHRSFLGDSERRVTGPGDLFVMAALERYFAPTRALSLDFGLSGAWGPSATGSDDRTSLYGADAELRIHPVTRESPIFVSVGTEWYYRRRAWLGTELQDLSSTHQLLCQFASRWAIAGRYEYGSPAVDAAVERVLPDPLDPRWDRDRHRVAGLLTFHLSESSRVRGQVSHDLPGWRAPVWAGFLALDLVAGAHRAHAHHGRAEAGVHDADGHPAAEARDHDHGQP